MCFPSRWHVCFLVIMLSRTRCSAFTSFPLAAPVVRQRLLYSFSSSAGSVTPSSITSAVNLTTAATATKDGSNEEEASALNLLPVGIFVDLDNIRWSTYGRANAQAFVRPLGTFSQRIGGKIDSFQAFGNLATRTWRPPEERARLEGGIDSRWDGEAHHTGYDKDGLLRCGICGAPMKLSKKDRAKGWGVEDKLNKHMKMLHDREQAKRKNLPKKLFKKKKVKEKFEKYKAAQIDTGRRKGGGRNRNQLFAILREVGIRCHAADDVDAALVKSARQWMGPLMPRKTSLLTPQQELLLSLSSPPPAQPSTVRGCLMVVSNDSDFCQLLGEGRRRGYLVVSVTLEETQTRALENVSDLVLRAGGGGGATTPDAMTRRGSEFMLRCEERWKKDHALSPMEVWDLAGTNDNDDENEAPSSAEESDDEKEDLGKDASTRNVPKTQQMEMPAPYSKKTLQRHPGLDMTNRDDAKRVAAFTKLVCNAKKRDRRDLARIELRIRLYHRGVYRSIPKLGRASTSILALVLHWTERGEKIRSNSIRSPERKYAKMSPKEQQKELQKRNIKHAGSKKKVNSQLMSAVSKDFNAEVMGRYRKALVERGLDDSGNQQEILDRLVKVVLGLEEIDFQ